MSTPAHEATLADSQPTRPLRIWPVVVVLLLLGVSKLLFYVLSEPSPAVFTVVMFAPLVCALLLALWWVGFSRATAMERVLGPATVIAIGILAYQLLHVSNQGMGSFFFFLPSGLAAVGLALVVLHRARPNLRLAGAIVAAIIGFAGWDLVRNDGIWGDFNTSLSWRWNPTAEERFLAELKQASDAPVIALDGAGTSVSAASFDNAPWPAFRGPNRDGSVPGVVLETDWKANPPKEIWRRKIGPGWSSFTVGGGLLFTQEQRGENEVIACYDAATGAQRWAHESPARFWEAVAGAGPRATPTLAGGKLYAVGATGLVHCLDPATGCVIWEQDIAKDADRDPPMWGFSGSPLVLDDTVIVWAGGEGDKGLLFYAAASGEPKGGAPAGSDSYSSPQVASVGGAQYILLLSNAGLAALSPRDGSLAWKYDWPYEGYRALQPLLIDDGVLLGTGMGSGTRRIDVVPGESDDGGPEFKERWTTTDLKPDYNDYVAHEGYLYGFDHNIFACIDLETGKRMWKKGRYGNGQVLLLPDADQLLVLSETGELVLLATNPKKLEELATHKVLNDKTWNHPVLIGDRLYVRNGEEAVCLQMPVKSGAEAGK